MLRLARGLDWDLSEGRGRCRAILLAFVGITGFLPVTVEMILRPTPRPADRVLVLLAPWPLTASVLSVQTRPRTELVIGLRERALAIEDPERRPRRDRAGEAPDISSVGDPSRRKVQGSVPPRPTRTARSTRFGPVRQGRRRGERRMGGGGGLPAPRAYRGW